MTHWKESPVSPMAHATCAIFIATTLDIGASESRHRKCFSSADSFPQNASTWAKYFYYLPQTRLWLHKHGHSCSLARSQLNQTDGSMTGSRSNVQYTWTPNLSLCNRSVNIWPACHVSDNDLSFQFPSWKLFVCMFLADPCEVHSDLLPPSLGQR